MRISMLALITLTACRWGGVEFREEADGDALKEVHSGEIHECADFGVFPADGLSVYRTRYREGNGGRSTLVDRTSLDTDPQWNYVCTTHVYDPGVYRVQYTRKDGTELATGRVVVK